MNFLAVLSKSNKPGEENFGWAPYFFIIIGSSLWTLAWVYPNQHQINFAQASIIRGITLIIGNYAVSRYYSVPLDFKSQKMIKILILRSLFVIFHGFLFAYSQYVLPLPIIQTINSSGALFVLIIDYFINGIKITYQQNIGVVIGILGLLLAINGQVISNFFNFTTQHKQTQFKNYVTQNIHVKSLFSVILVGAVILLAFGIVITKDSKANAFQINYILGIALLFGGACVYPVVESSCNFIQLGLSSLFLGATLVLSQWLYIGALTMNKNHGVLTLLGSVSILVGYIVSILRYDEIPNYLSLFGVIVLLLGIWKTAFSKK